MAFVATEGPSTRDHGAEGIPTGEVTPGLVAIHGFQGRLRHDLAPVETSQVAGVSRLGDEAVGHQNVVPAVSIEIDEA